MNEFERSYQHYLRTLPRREAKRLRSAAWAKAHPTYWADRKPIRPIKFKRAMDELADWLAEVREQVRREAGAPRFIGVDLASKRGESCYLWVKEPHPVREVR